MSNDLHPVRFTHIATLILQQNKITALQFVSNSTAVEGVDLIGVGYYTALISIIISECFLHFSGRAGVSLWF